MNSHQIFNTGHFLSLLSFTVIVLLWCFAKAFPQKYFIFKKSQEKNFWQVWVSNNFEIIELNWIRISKTNGKTVVEQKKNMELRRMIIILWLPVWHMVGSLMFYFSRFEEIFSLKLSMTYNLVKYTLINKDETLTFSPTWSLQNLGTLEFLFMIKYLFT